MMSDDTKTIDCVLCGSCVVDILCRPMPIREAIGPSKLVAVEPIQLTTGGIVSNSGVAMARLGMKVAAFSYVGDDDWAGVIRRRYDAEGLDTAPLMTHPTEASSTTVVLIDLTGERSFGHCVGAPRMLDKATFLDHLDLFEQSRMTLLGYYSLLPNLESDLPEVFAAMRQVGCRTALDSAGDGGGLEPLDRILPHLDVFVPSVDEAAHQTGLDDPQQIVEKFRSLGAPGMLGLKLGSKGALLSPGDGQWIEVSIVTPPGGKVVDTTGAGDCFYAGLLTGLLRGLSANEAGRLAAATGACCVAALGASEGIRDYDETAKLAAI